LNRKITLNLPLISFLKNYIIAGGEMINKDKKIANMILSSYMPNTAFPFGTFDYYISLKTAKIIYSRIYARGIEARVEFLFYLSDLRGCFFANDAKKIAWVKRQYLKLCEVTLRFSTAIAMMMFRVKSKLQSFGAI